MEMRARVVGQDEAIDQLTRHYQSYLTGLNSPGRPICNLLLLGPTGCGKTRLAESLAEALVGDPHALIKVDCGEFQHSHEISKLIGSPPGYLGHRETHARLCQEKLDAHHTERVKVSFVLFDEIEKASDALWNLLLGILDKGTLTLGDNRHADFSRTMVLMTGNLGTKEAQRLRDLPWGFASQEVARPTQQLSGEGCTNSSLKNTTDWGDRSSNGRSTPDGIGHAGLATPATASTVPQRVQPHLARAESPSSDNAREAAGCGNMGSREAPNTDVSKRKEAIPGDQRLRARMQRAVQDAAKRKFSPEFLNRLDGVIMCHALTEQEIGRVLDLELRSLLLRVQRHRGCSLQISLSDQARALLIAEGYDPNAGARYLKRAIERHFVHPLSSLLATHQLADGDELLVDADMETTELIFSRAQSHPARRSLREISARWGTRSAATTT